MIKKIIDQFVTWAVFSIVVFLAFLSLKTCLRETPSLDTVTIARESWDSLLKVANSVPDTVIRYDTIRPEPEIIVKYVAGTGTFENDTLISFADSLIDERVAINTNTWLNTQTGLYGQKIAYELFAPTQIYVTEQVTKEVPVPVIEYRDIRHSFFIASGGVGTDFQGLYFLAGLDFVTKKNRAYGLQFIKGNNDFVMLKYGIKFKL